MSTTCLLRMVNPNIVFVSQFRTDIRNLLQCLCKIAAKVLECYEGIPNGRYSC
jgi:hypothetical protein